MTRRGPTYSLADLQRRAASGAYVVTRSAYAGAGLLGFDESDVLRCLLGMTPGDFYKTMESVERPGLWQDVYRPVYSGEELYVKLQLSLVGRTVVISFKEL